MPLPKIKAAISRVHDLKELYAIRAHVADRIKTEETAAHQRAVAAAWDRAKTWHVGQTIYCCMDGISLGGGWQKGDSGELTAIQPRAKRIWIKRNGTSYWFEPVAINRYNFQAEPPARAMSLEERQFANAAGRAFQAAIQNKEKADAAT